MAVTRELQLKCISHKAILIGAHLVHCKIGIGFMKDIIKSPPNMDNLKKNDRNCHYLYSGYS